MHFFSQINRDGMSEQTTDFLEKMKREMWQRDGKCAVCYIDGGGGGSGGIPSQFRVLCFCRENNLHMHKFAFRILIYTAQSPCTSATTSAQQNRQNNDDGQTQRQWKKKQRRRRWRRNKWPSDIKTFTREKDCSFCADSGLCALFFSVSRVKCQRIRGKRLLRIEKKTGGQRERRKKKEERTAWNCWQNKSTNGKFSWVGESIREPIAATVVSFAFCRSFCVYVCIF